MCMQWNGYQSGLEIDFGAICVLWWIISAERQNYKPTAQKLAHPEALLLMLRAFTNDDRYIEMLTFLTEKEKKGDQL